MSWIIDTHVLLWMAAGDSRLSPDFISRLKQDEPPLRISAASAWELAIKVESGKLTLPEPVDAYWVSRCASFNLEEVSVSSNYAIAAAKLPLIHRDPFDRVIAALAIIDNMTLVTADPVFTRYGCKVIEPTR